MARRDGRSANQLRPPQVELRPLQRADGSARFRFGDCTVLAAVYGPKEPRTRHRELCDRCTLDVVVRPRVGIPGPQERQMEALLARQLEYVVLATEYPRTQISVIVQMSCCDGSTAAVAGNAAHLALLDAGVAMKATAMCVALGVKLSPEPVIWLDPTELEEAQCDALISLSMDGSRRRQVLQGVSRHGVFPRVSRRGNGASAALWDSGQVLEAFMRMSLQKRLEGFLKPNA
ncbi:unnamed protein product [Durusdinium trenchii]|uniref:Exoribonuclease phosphorolytic domain-containing protein n=1 Tax=Durusdinium trenchii TaxID=1381693 RepID=A0ABP0I435_9DINO